MRKTRLQRCGRDAHNAVKTHNNMSHLDRDGKWVNQWSFIFIAFIVCDRVYLVVTISTTATAAAVDVAAIIVISALLLFYFNEFDGKTNLIRILLLLSLLLLKCFIFWCVIESSLQRYQLAQNQNQKKNTRIDESDSISIWSDGINMQILRQQFPLKKLKTLKIMVQIPKLMWNFHIYKECWSINMNIIL